MSLIDRIKAALTAAFDYAQMDDGKAAEVSPRVCAVCRRT